MDEIIAQLTRLGCDEDDTKTIVEKLAKGGYNKLAKLSCELVSSFINNRLLLWAPSNCG